MLVSRRREKRKMTRVGGRGSFCNGLWISVTRYLTQSLRHRGETVEICCVKPGLAVYIR